MPDAIELLKHDHRTVEKLFTEFESTGDRSVAEQIFEEFVTHAELEEQLVYPLLREAVNVDLAEEGEQEHQQTRELIERMRSRSGEGDQLMPMMQELKQQIQHHVEEEESESLPQMREKLGADRMQQLGQQIADRKQQEQPGGEVRTSGTSAPDTDGMTKQELYEVAKEAGIEGRSKMNKDELAQAVEQQA